MLEGVCEDEIMGKSLSRLVLRVRESAARVQEGEKGERE